MKRIFIVVAAAIYSSLGTKYTHTQNMASSSIIITCRKIFITLHYLLPDTGTYRHDHLLDCHQRKIERKNKTEYQQNKKHSNESKQNFPASIYTCSQVCVICIVHH